MRYLSCYHRFFLSLAVLTAMTLSVASCLPGRDGTAGPQTSAPLTWRAAPAQTPWQPEPQPQQKAVTSVVPVPQPPQPSHAAGVIAIIIDDMGIDRPRSLRAVNLPPEITLSFLPYANHLKDVSDRAREKGHELMLHLPMAPDNDKENPGPDVLRPSQSVEEIRAITRRAIDSFHGYVAVNNHMGSRFTRDRAMLLPVMEELSKRDVIFIDSKTTPDSVAYDMAREAGMKAGSRDVFLDNTNTAVAIAGELARLEKIAHKKGVAIAIGHPKDNTLAALEAWIPTLAAKNLRLVPVTAVAR